MHSNATNLDKQNPKILSYVAPPVAAATAAAAAAAAAAARVHVHLSKGSSSTSRQQDNEPPIKFVNKLLTMK